MSRGCFASLNVLRIIKEKDERNIKNIENNKKKNKRRKKKNNNKLNGLLFS